MIDICTSPIVNCNNDDKDNEETLDITNLIKVYNNSIPLWVFIKNNNIDTDKYDSIRFTYLYIAQMRTKEILIDTYKNECIYKIFM